MYFENAIAPCGTCGVSCLMRTFTDRITPSYPVGVFNIEGEYLGIAESPYEYITLWNDDPVNQLKGTLKQGSYDFEFKFVANPGESPLSSVLGLRYWQVEATTIAGLLVNGDDKIEIEGSITNGSAYAAITNFKTFDTYQGLELYAVRPGVQGRVAKIDIVGTKTVRVFHNESGYFAGLISGPASYAQCTPYVDAGIENASNTQLSGNFPKSTEVIIVCSKDGYVTENINPANINMQELTNLKAIGCMMNRFGKPNLTGIEYNYDAWIDAIPNPDNLISFFGWQQSGAVGGSNGDSVDLTRFQNLKYISFGVSSYPFTMPADFPKFTELFQVTHGQFSWNPQSSADVDTMFNQLAINLNGIIPTGLRRIRLSFYSPAPTAASASARAYLQGQGWIIS